MIPNIDFNNLETKAEWHAALDKIVAAATTAVKHNSDDRSKLQTLLLAYVEKCPFDAFGKIAQDTNTALGKQLISSSIKKISSRNDDITGATGEIDDVTSAANDDASGLLLEGPLKVLGAAKEALDALKPPAAAGAKAAGSGDDA
jgi:hypothetical protein